jgi:hypothetical protein
MDVRLYEANKPHSLINFMNIGTVLKKLISVIVKVRQTRILFGNVILTRSGKGKKLAV